MITRIQTTLRIAVQAAALFALVSIGWLALDLRQDAQQLTVELRQDAQQVAVTAHTADELLYSAEEPVRLSGSILDSARDRARELLQLYEQRDLRHRSR